MSDPEEAVEHFMQLEYAVSALARQRYAELGPWWRCETAVSHVSAARIDEFVQARKAIELHNLTSHNSAGSSSGAVAAPPAGSEDKYLEQSSS